MSENNSKSLILTILLFNASTGYIKEGCIEAKKMSKKTKTKKKHRSKGKKSLFRWGKRKGGRMDRIRRVEWSRKGGDERFKMLGKGNTEREHEKQEAIIVTSGEKQDQVPGGGINFQKIGNESEQVRRTEEKTNGGGKNEVGKREGQGQNFYKIDNINEKKDLNKSNEESKIIQNKKREEEQETIYGQQVGPAGTSGQMSLETIVVPIVPISNEQTNLGSVNVQQLNEVVSREPESEGSGDTNDEFNHDTTTNILSDNGHEEAVGSGVEEVSISEKNDARVSQSKEVETIAQKNEGSEKNEGLNLTTTMVTNIVSDNGYEEAVGSGVGGVSKKNGQLQDREGVGEEMGSENNQNSLKFCRKSILVTDSNGENEIVCETLAGKSKEKTKGCWVRLKDQVKSFFNFQTNNSASDYQQVGAGGPRGTTTWASSKESKRIKQSWIKLH